jgi:multidrug efflux pump subunit AcrB
MNLSAPFIRRPIGTSLLMIAVLLAGFVSYLALPVAPLPQVDFSTIVVSASLPGASPETIASSVTTPLERQFGQISGVAQMTSTSSLGLTVNARLKLPENQRFEIAIVSPAGAVD